MSADPDSPEPTEVKSKKVSLNFMVYKSHYVLLLTLYPMLLKLISCPMTCIACNVS